MGLSWQGIPKERKEGCLLNALDLHSEPLPLAVFQLGGSQADMGQQHGSLLRQIGGFEPALDYYPRMTEGLLRGGSIKPIERLFPVAMRPVFELWLQKLERHRPPELLARTRAFYRELGTPDRMTRYLMTMDLFQNVVGMAGRARQGGFINPWSQRGFAACSSLAAWGDATEDGRLLVARNFDFPGIGTWDSAPAVVFCSPDRGVRYGFVTCRGVDVPGITAFNEAGLTITFHTRFHQDVAFSGIAAVDLGHEVVRRATCLDEAIALIRSKRSASAWGMLIASSRDRRAVVVETTAKGVGVTEARPGEPFVGCTNHFRHADLHRGELMPCSAWLPGTVSRLTRMEQLARGAMDTGGLSVSELWAILGDRTDPHLPAQTRVSCVLVQPYGVQSVVIDPERQTIDVTTGRCPASCGSTRTIPWKWSTDRRVEEIMPTAAPLGRTGATEEAYRWYLRAVQLEGQGGDPHEMETALRTAADLDPEDSTLQLLAGGCALRQGEWAIARLRFEQGIKLEQAPFYRGRLLFWAARAARAQGDRETASRYQEELRRLDHPWLVPLQDAAKRDRQFPPSKTKLRHTTLHVGLGDL